MVTVLLIDDDPLQLQVRKEVLRRAGFGVCVATSTDSALALLRTGGETGAVDAIVTDHVMPQGTGSQFVKSLRQLNPQVPVLVVTGLADAEPEYKNLGVLFRQKPLTPTELIGLVESMTRGRA